MSAPLANSSQWSWGSFQPSFQSSNSASSSAPNNNAQVQPQPVVQPHNANPPYIVIPVPVSNQQPSEVPRRQSYHISFVNNENPLSVRLINNRTHTITTNMVGRGTKFECEVPIDQNVDVEVIALSNAPAAAPENGIIAQVDNDPFGLRRIGPLRSL
jgi:hypothetical protein